MQCVTDKIKLEANGENKVKDVIGADILLSVSSSTLTLPT